VLAALADLLHHQHSLPYHQPVRFVFSIIRVS
jgi:hypothetical protein